MDLVTIDDFKKLDLRVAKVISAARVEGSEKLLRLEVDLGGEERQLVAGIGKVYAPEELIGKNIVVVANLEARRIMGLESQGMLLAAAANNDEPAILVVEREVPPGSRVS